MAGKSKVSSKRSSKQTARRTSSSNRTNIRSGKSISSNRSFSFTGKSPAQQITAELQNRLSSNLNTIGHFIEQQQSAVQKQLASTKSFFSKVQAKAKSARVKSSKAAARVRSGSGSSRVARSSLAQANKQFNAASKEAAQSGNKLEFLTNQLQAIKSIATKFDTLVNTVTTTAAKWEKEAGQKKKAGSRKRKNSLDQRQGSTKSPWSYDQFGLNYSRGNHATNRFLESV
jgi:hypothetical protein